MVAMGGDPAADVAGKRAALTFKAVVDLFLEEHVSAKRKSSTAVGYASLLATYAVPALGNRKADAITRAEIAHLHDQLKDKPYQANRLLAVISSLYTFAERRGLVPESRNPAKKIEKFPEERRERFLTPGELERLGTWPGSSIGRTCEPAWTTPIDTISTVPIGFLDEAQLYHSRRSVGRTRLLKVRQIDAARACPALAATRAACRHGRRS